MYTPYIAEPPLKFLSPAVFLGATKMADELKRNKLPFWSHYTSANDHPTSVQFMVFAFPQPGYRRRSSSHFNNALASGSLATGSKTSIVMWPHLPRDYRAANYLISS